MDKNIQLGAEMLINPFEINGVAEARKMLKNIDGLGALIEFCSVKKHTPFKPVIRYIVILYSKDSFLNKKPMRPLTERQLKAAALAGFEKQRDGEFHPQVRFSLFELGAEEIFDFVFGYLVYQKNYVWSEICTLEAQISENQRIRMRAIESDKDKDIMAAMDKKASLTKHYKEWHKSLEDNMNEFFGDHEEVKVAYDIHKTGLATIELYAQEK